MRYEIGWAAAALRQLRTLDEQTARRVLRAVSTLATDPRPAGVRALAGRPSGTTRLRVGDYRVVYVIEDERVHVVVVRVAHRRHVSRDL